MRYGVRSGLAVAPGRGSKRGPGRVRKMPELLQELNEILAA